MEIRREKTQTPLQESLKKILSNRLYLVNLIVLVILILFPIFGPVFTGYESDSIDLLNMFTSSNDTHLPDMDELGRDMLTRLTEGGRVSISVGLIATLFKLCIGVLLGCIVGPYGRTVESVIMHAMDIIMCFPFFVIALYIAVTTGPSFHNTIFIIGILGRPSVCYIVHSQVPNLKDAKYVDTARSLGLGQIEIILCHILPNTSDPIIVYTTLSVTNAILMEASLSFLGLGIAMPRSSWSMALSITQNTQIPQDYWWMWILADILVLNTVLTASLLGDGLSKTLDPKKKGEDVD